MGCPTCGKNPGRKGKMVYWPCHYMTFCSDECMKQKSGGPCPLCGEKAVKYDELDRCEVCRRHLIGNREVRRAGMITGTDEVFLRGVLHLCPGIGVRHDRPVNEAEAPRQPGDGDLGGAGTPDGGPTPHSASAAGSGHRLMGYR